MSRSLRGRAVPITLGSTTRGERSNAVECGRQSDGASPAGPTSPRASRPAANAAAKNAGSSSGPRPMCESGRPAHGLLPALAVFSPTTHLAEAGRSTASRVVGDAAVALARDPRRRRARRPPAGRRAPIAAFAAVAAASPAVTEPRAGPDDAGPDRADGDLVARPSPMRSADQTVTHLDVAAEARADRRDGRPRACAPCSARTVSDSATGKRPARELDVGDPRPASAAHTGATWLWSEQQTTGMPSRSIGRAPPAPRHAGPRTGRGVYGSFITCAPGSAASPSPRVRFT